MSMLPGLAGLRQLFGIPAARARPDLGAALGPAPRVRWLVTVPWVGAVEVWARTRSEARAAGKRELGLNSRLPVGSVVQRLG